MYGMIKNKVIGNCVVSAGRDSHAEREAIALLIRKSDIRQARGSEPQW